MCNFAEVWPDMDASVRFGKPHLQLEDYSSPWEDAFGN